MKSLVKQMRPALAKGAIVTDVGSVKGSVVRELEGTSCQNGREVYRQSSDGLALNEWASPQREAICSTTQFAS